MTKEVIEMGQTDSQFKAFIRFILDDIKELQSEPDDAKRSAKKIGRAHV